MRHSTLIAIALLGSLTACGGAQKEPAEDPAAAQAAADQETIENFEPPADPTALETVESLAGQVAGQWDSQKATGEEVMLLLKLRVDGKSAVVKAGTSAEVLTGPDAASAEADVTVDVPADLARDLVDGESTLKASLDKVETDNQDGLTRFAEFLKE